MIQVLIFIFQMILFVSPKKKTLVKLGVAAAVYNSGDDPEIMRHLNHIICILDQVLEKHH